MWFFDAAAAFFMGALSGMGIGGGGLLVIYLTLFKGAEQIEAQGLNLYFFLFASAAALFVHSAKREINYPLVLLVAAAGMPLSLLGSRLASATDPHILRVMFGIMLVLAGGISLARSWKSRSRHKKARKK